MVPSSSGSVLSTRRLNRATLARQGLLERFDGEPADAVRRLAGLQAQHANWPFVALWSRQRDLRIADLEAALEARTVVKATVIALRDRLDPAPHSGSERSLA